MSCDANHNRLFSEEEGLIFSIKTVLFILVTIASASAYGGINEMPDKTLQYEPPKPVINTAPGPEYADEVRKFQGIPSIAVSPGGRIWATWYGGGTGEGPENYIMLATSGDDGITWSDLKMVIDDPPSHRNSEPALWLDPDEKLWLMWNEYPHGLRSREGRLWAITAEDPDREDPGWSEPRLIAMELHNFNKPAVLSDGTWLWPSGSWNPDNSSRPLLSGDEGKTFNPGGEIPMPADIRTFEEYQVVERKQGDLWLLTRTSYGIGESFSKDGGQTWSGVQRSDIRHTDSRFFITRLQSGNLLLVKHGLIGQNVGRRDLMAFLSEDDGESWSGGLMLESRDCSYPDGMQTADGTVYVIYDRSRHEDKEILMTRFAEQDVAAGRMVSERSAMRLLVNRAGGESPRQSMPATLKRNKNEDGVAFESGPRTALHLDEAKSAKIENGAFLFSDRAYTWCEVPDDLKGLNYIYGSINGGSFRVKQDGFVYVATPLKERNVHSLQGDLFDKGFSKTDVTEFQIFSHPDMEGTLCSVFQKKITEGETLTMGKWGVVLH